MPQYEDVYEPPMLDSTGQAILQAIQALSAPSATNVAVDPTGMDIITAENAQGALKQLDTAVSDVNASLTQFTKCKLIQLLNLTSVTIPAQSKGTILANFNPFTSTLTDNITGQQVKNLFADGDTLLGFSLFWSRGSCCSMVDGGTIYNGKSTSGIGLYNMSNASFTVDAVSLIVFYK